MNYRETDTEFAERFEHFAFEEVVQEEGQQLEETACLIPKFYHSSCLFSIFHFPSAQNISFRHL